MHHLATANRYYYDPAFSRSLHVSETFLRSIRSLEVRTNLKDFSEQFLALYPNLQSLRSLELHISSVWISEVCFDDPETRGFEATEIAKAYSCLRGLQTLSIVDHSPKSIFFKNKSQEEQHAIRDRVKQLESVMQQMAKRPKGEVLD